MQGANLMYTNVNLEAPIGALALLGTGGLLFVGALALIYFLARRKIGGAKIMLAAMVIISAAYVGAMLVFSFTSHETLLARGQEKHFCELDCHLAYSVVNTQQVKSIASAPNQLTAQGQFTVVTLKTRFDETTIGPSRGDSQLYPNSRALTLVDDRGNRYGPVAQLNTPLTTPLRPGESYVTDMVFDLPRNAKPTALLMNEREWVTHLVIGHENSPLHKQTKFQI
jgi:hypothetical protein